MSPTASSTPAGSPPAKVDPAIEEVSAAAYTIATDAPEADGTLSWSATTMVAVTVRGGGATGLGWTYGPAACAGLVEDVIAPAVVGLCVLDVPAAARAADIALRNTPRPGLGAYAASAVDVALWDLKARLMGVSLPELLGRVRREVPVYGSGGFVTYDDQTTAEQLRGWLETGARATKIKIGEGFGAGVGRDLHRTELAREVVGPDVELMVDANGAYDRKQAVAVGRRLEDLGVRWFEEPVTSDDKDGLLLVRNALDLAVTAGEYATDVYEMRRLCGVVDCLQVDLSRCGGVTAWQRAAAVAASFGLDVSGHCAPHLHLAAAAATPNFRHLEWFHDHVRIEGRYLDGAEQMLDGAVAVDSAVLGHGYELKVADLASCRVG